MITDAKLIAGAVAAVSVIALVLGYGKMQYNRGVENTTALFEAADKKGAENVRKIAEKIRSGLDPAADVDELLDRTGGLRDAEGTLPPTEPGLADSVCERYGTD